MLEPCADRMDQGFSRVYQRYLLNQLKLNATRKLLQYPNSLPVNLFQLKKLRRVRDFDDAITAKFMDLMMQEIIIAVVAPCHCYRKSVSRC